MRRKPLLIASGAAAVVALGVVGAVLFWPGSGSSPGPSAPTTPRAAGTRAAPPEKHGATATPPSTGAPAKGATTAAPPAQPNPVRVRFRVTPASARITVDGKPAASEISLPPSPSPHSLLIEAQGYRSDQREFVAVSDRELTVSLSPEPAAAAAPVKTAAAPAAAPARRKAAVKPVAAAKPAGQKPAKAGSSAFAPVGLD
jgi:hypothetical protein